MTGANVAAADDQLAANMQDVISRIYHLCPIAKVTLADANKIVVDENCDFAKAQTTVINYLAEPDLMGRCVSQHPIPDSNFR